MVGFVFETAENASEHVKAVRAAALPGFAKSARKRFEERGIVFEGAVVRTDADGQAKITATMMAFNAGVIDRVDFMVGTGEFLSLDAEDFAALHAAVVAHVQNSFSRLATLSAKIEAGAATIDDVRAAFDD